MPSNCKRPPPGQAKILIAVVSPFLDKRHGTERCVAEQVERLANDFEIHVYSNRVEDIDLGRIIWHRVPALPGPHLLAYSWWFIANHLWRWWDRRFRGLRFELTYTPGVNCLDADVISVHIVFTEFYRKLRSSLRLGVNPVRAWPGLIHRRIYYRLVTALEQRIYGEKRAILSPVSAKVARDLERFRHGSRVRLMDGHKRGCRDAEHGGGRAAVEQLEPGGHEEFHFSIIRHGIDSTRFNAEVRSALRPSARRQLGLDAQDFCLLMVGNDWKNKGLPCLIEALGQVPDGVRLLVVGRDTAEPYRSTLARIGLEERVSFQPPRPDVEFYYAAADVYTGPSLDDAFGMPPLEAMACGIPAIVSSQAGVSEIVTAGIDALVLEEPRDSDKMAELIALLYSDRSLLQRMGEAAAQTAKQFTWGKNVQQLTKVFGEVLRSKSTMSDDKVSA